MKEGITFPEVQGVLLVIARMPVDGNFHWHTYIINTNDYHLSNLLMVSKGYSTSQVPKLDTSILRYFIELLKSNSYAIIETLDPAVFELFNEFGISYYYDQQTNNKSFVFTPGSIIDKHLVEIEALNLQGVLYIK